MSIAEFDECLKANKCEFVILEFIEKPDSSSLIDPSVFEKHAHTILHIRQLKTSELARKYIAHKQIVLIRSQFPDTYGLDALLECLADKEEEEQVQADLLKARDEL